MSDINQENGSSHFEQQVDNGTLGQEEEIKNEQLQEEQDDSSEQETEKQVDFDKKFAALSRKEKEIRQKEAEREEVWSRKMEELEAKIQELESRNEPEPEPEEEPELPLEYRLKKDPLKTLQELGYDYETLTELVLNEGKLTSDMQLNLLKEDLKREMEEKYGSLEQKLLEKEKREEEEKYNQIVNGFKNDIEDFVSKDPEAYELIQANNANDLVFEVIEEHYNETGSVLDIKTAAEAVESYLEEEAKKLLKLKKLSRAEALAEENKKPIEKRQPSPTLSNDQSAASQNNADRKLSVEESISEAAKLLKWED